MKVSVIIITYNGAQRFPAVLAALASQAGTREFEIILVDNNSTDETKSIAQGVGISNFRYVFEATPGISHARDAGVRAARGEIVGFVDDDNIPNETWVREVEVFFEEHPKAGLVGSRVINAIPAELRSKIGFGNSLLGESDFGEAALQLKGDSYQSINGAGLAARKQLWIEVAQHLVLRGRTGKGLTGGEDREMMYRVLQAGHQVWYNPRMLIDHRIEQRRWSSDYLEKLALASGTAQPFLRRLKRKLGNRNSGAAFYMCADFIRFLKASVNISNRFEKRLWRQYYLGCLLGNFESYLNSSQ